MALQKSFDGASTTYPNAYHRITAIYIDLDDATIEVVVSISATAGDRLAGKIPVSARRYVLTRPVDLAPFKNGANNAIAVAYAWLKQRTDYAGADDV